MADNTEQIDQTGFAEISDETVRRFLLCRLAGAEQVTLEERLFKDQDLEERVRLAEFELADDYAFERLSAADREQFEKVFAVSVRRRQQLRASLALRESSLLAPEAAPLGETKSPNASLGDAFFRLLGINRPQLGYALGFAVLLLLVGIVWVVVKQSQSEPPTIVTYVPTPSPAPANPTSSPAAGSSVSPELPAKASPAPDPSSRPLLATILLSPGALRDGGEMVRIAVPQNERGTVRLQLRLEAEEPGPYRAELLTAEGQSLYVGRKLKTSKTAAGLQVAFEVPAELLKKNDYQVKLSRTAGASATSVGRYSFRVTE